MDENRPLPPADQPDPGVTPDELSGRSRTSSGTRARRAGAVAAGVALALGAGGVAYAASTSGPTDASHGSGYGAAGDGGPAGEERGPGGPGLHGGKGGGFGFGVGPGGRVLHGEATVQDGDSATKTVFVQSGTITAVSATSLTVKSTDGFSKTYVLNTDTKVRTPDALAVNDEVGVTADVAGTTATATHVVEKGAMPPRPEGGTRPTRPGGTGDNGGTATPTPSGTAAPSSRQGAASSGTGTNT